jgi:hypothetical protein
MYYHCGKHPGMGSINTIVDSASASSSASEGSSTIVVDKPIGIRGKLTKLAGDAKVSFGVSPSVLKDEFGNSNESTATASRFEWTSYTGPTEPKMAIKAVYDDVRRRELDGTLDNGSESDLSQSELPNSRQLRRKKIS